QTNRSTHRQSPVNSSPSALRRRSAAVDERAYRRHTQNCQRGFVKKSAFRAFLLKSPEIRLFF
ncbi:hypothetical protein, partial [Oryzibacter oryziterrae]|uniref:hypothetical protein n=1 Tax=Oryzibacter oryziterrae TaxID=2766474 RepID=UPI001F4897C0